MTCDMKESKLIFTNRVSEALDSIVNDIKPHGGIYIICDTNSRRYVVDKLIAESRNTATADILTISPGDINKNIDTLTYVWQQLSDKGATRHSLIINAGGGVVTDLGGMAAATFKRGVRFINIPTTLLGAVDAAVGGKTGINLGNLKNEVGVFAPADYVIISTCYFKTLPDRELLSGYAEMVKHGLLKGINEFESILHHDVLADDVDALLDLLRDSINIKASIVQADPVEKGLRRVLNLGHTAGHAFETLKIKHNTPVPHGYAIAWGILVSLILSHTVRKLSSDIIYKYSSWLKEIYPHPGITCRDYTDLIKLMGHDKKNETTGEIAFVLLDAPGKPVERTVVSEADIRSALDIFQDLL